MGVVRRLADFALTFAFAFAFAWADGLAFADFTLVAGLTDGTEGDAPVGGGSRNVRAMSSASGLS